MCTKRVKITEKLKISFGQFTCSKLKNDLNCGSTNVFPIIITHIQVALFHVKELASYGSKSCFQKNKQQLEKNSQSSQDNLKLCPLWLLANKTQALQALYRRQTQPYHISSSWLTFKIQTALGFKTTSCSLSVLNNVTLYK